MINTMFLNSFKSKLNLLKAVSNGGKHLRRLGTNETLIPVLTLFTKEDCQLCDEALEILAPHLHKVQLKEVDITEPGNEEWFGKYRYEIPVFYLQNKFLCKNKIDIDTLFKELDILQQN